MRLSGKNAAITGASQGLGLAIARQFVREGARVAICGRHAPDLESAAQSLMSEASGRVLHAVADVSRETEVDAFAEFCGAGLGGVDILSATPASTGRRAASKRSTGRHGGRLSRST